MKSRYESKRKQICCHLSRQFIYAGYWGILPTRFIYLDLFIYPELTFILVGSKPEVHMPVALSLKAAAAKSLQSCPALCDPIDGSPPGFPVPGILQARTLEWVAISFSSARKWKVKSLSRVRLFVTPWTAAYQAPPSMGFSRHTL